MTPSKCTCQDKLSCVTYVMLYDPIGSDITPSPTATVSIADDLQQTTSLVETEQVSIRITPSIIRPSSSPLTPRMMDVFTRTAISSSTTVSCKMIAAIQSDEIESSFVCNLPVPTCSCRKPAFHLPMYQRQELVVAPQTPELHGSRSPSPLEQASSLLCQQLCVWHSRIHTGRVVFCERRDKQVRMESWNPPHEQSSLYCMDCHGFSLLKLHQLLYGCDFIKWVIGVWHFVCCCCIHNTSAAW